MVQKKRVDRERVVGRGGGGESKEGRDGKKGEKRVKPWKEEEKRCRPQPTLTASRRHQLCVRGEGGKKKGGDLKKKASEKRGGIGVLRRTSRRLM